MKHPRINTFGSGDKDGTDEVYTVLLTCWGNTGHIPLLVQVPSSHSCRYHILYSNIVFSLSILYDDMEKKFRGY